MGRRGALAQRSDMILGETNVPATKIQSRLRLLIGIAMVAVIMTDGSAAAAAGLAPAKRIARKLAVPPPTVGKPYAYDVSKTFECATNPAPVFAFTWQNPAPVPGLAFATSGLISGTPLVAGTFNLAFQVTDVSGAPGACTGTSSDTGILTVNAAPVSVIAPVPGSNNQVAPPNTPLSQPLTARLVDSAGNPVPGVAVAWTVGAAGGTLTNPSLVSNAQGQVQAGFTTGPTGENATVTVRATGTTTVFQFTVLNQQSTVDAPSQEVTTPAVVTAVTAPTIQINNIRQRLDQIRFQHSPAVAQALKVNVGGQPLPPLSALALGPSPSRDGKAVTGGGASADKPVSGGGAAADQPDPFGRWGAYVNGDVDIGRQSAVDTQAGFKLTSNGLTFGTDYRFEGNHVLGAALGLLKADTNVADGGSQDAKGYSLSVYGSYVPVESAYIDGIVNVGHNKYDSQRQQTAGGSATSNTSGDQFAVALSAGWNYSQGAFTANPYLRVEYVEAKIDGFTENGSPTEALTVSEQRVKATTLTLGGQVSYAVSTTWGVLVPYGRLDLQYVAQSNAQDVTAQLVGLTAPATIVPTLGQDKTFGTFAAGASAILPNGFSCFFNYEQLFGKENFKDQKYTLGLRVEF
jgi:outer membrane autotransporter protein